MSNNYFFSTPGYFNDFTYNDSSSTTSSDQRIEPRRLKTFKVENNVEIKMRDDIRKLYMSEPMKFFEKVKIDPPFMRYTQDLGLDEEFIKHLKSDIKLQEEQPQTELMFDPANLDV